MPHLAQLLRDLSRIVKEWRESVKYLRSIDRARLMRRCGSVLTIDMAALRQVKEKNNADQAAAAGKGSYRRLQ